MKISALTSIGRAIDPRYPTNLAIALLSVAVLVAGMAAKLLAGWAWMPAAGWGIGAALAVFLAWALGRELDPDHDLSAFVGAGFMALAAWFVELPVLLPLFWIVVLARIVNRTIGLPAGLLDSLLLLALGALLAWQTTWVVGVVTAGAFLVDSRLSLPLKRHLPFAGLALAVGLVSLALGGNPAWPVGLTAAVLLALLLTSALFLLVVVRSPVTRTLGDVTGEPLDPKRVRAAQGLSVVAAWSVALWLGDRGALALLPLWAALLGTALFGLGERILHGHPAGGAE